MEMHSIEKWLVNSRIWSWILKHWMMPRLFSCIEPLKGKVLELGCGQGVTSECLLETYPDIALTALDYDLHQVKLSQSRLTKFGKRATPVRGDATNLSIKENSFDTVIELNAFHHIKDFKTAMQESFRVLKPGGLFIAKDVSVLLTKPIEPWSAEGFFTKNGFIRDLSSIGFSIQKTKGLVWFLVVCKKPI